MKDWIALGSSLLYSLGGRHVAQSGPHLPARLVVPQVAHLTPEESDDDPSIGDLTGFSPLFSPRVTPFNIRFTVGLVLTPRSLAA